MGIFAQKDPGEWVPTKGDIVKLNEPAPDLWDELKDIEGRVTEVEMAKPPHAAQPTGRLLVVFPHNGIDRSLSAHKGIFVFLRKG